VVAGAAIAIGCTASPAPARLPPPTEHSAESQAAYGAYLLSIGDPAAARGYLEPAAASDAIRANERPQLLRDLAEARLFSGDSPAALEVAQSAQDALGRVPRTAQFQDADRQLFERVLEGLDAASAGDLDRLSAVARDESPTPSADAWYLLGWLDEQRGDLAGARAAYHAYLARDPRWTFLRSAAIMRRHAQEIAP